MVDSSYAAFINMYKYVKTWNFSFIQIFLDTLILSKMLKHILLFVIVWRIDVYGLYFSLYSLKTCKVIIMYRV